MERLNYHHLYLFWILAKEGTFTKAAERLSIAQSAVTSQIKSLEEVLSISLLDRTNRRKPVLTEDGKSVLDFANSIFETGDELLKWAKGGSVASNQSLRVGALSGLSRNFQFEFLKPIMGRKDIRLEVTTGDQDKLVRLLKEHHLDLILSSHNVPAEGRVTFHSTVIASSPLVFVVSKYAKVKGRKLNTYLSELPLYLPGRSFETRPELDAYLEQIRCSKTIVGEIDDIALLRLFAMHSKALVVVPEMGVRGEIASRAVHVVERPQHLSQRFYAIARQRRNPNPIAEHLVKTMKES